jgi:glyoxylase-like metal-dependent hydrolase (beta-lactamase superfamily II)
MAHLDWRNAAIDARMAAGEEIRFIAEHVKVELTEEQRRELVIALPDVVYDERLEVDLGGLTCQMLHVGGDHSPDSSVIYVPEEGVVFLGDCLYNGFAGETLFYTPGRLFPLLACLEDLPARFYVMAHHPKAWTREEFMANASLLRRIGGLVEESGGDARAALARLPQAAGGEATQEALEHLNAFLVGKKMQP